MGNTTPGYGVDDYHLLTAFAPKCRRRYSQMLHDAAMRATMGDTASTLMMHAAAMAPRDEYDAISLLSKRHIILSHRVRGTFMRERSTYADYY